MCTADDAETHVLVMLILEKTSLHIAGNRAIRVALELIQQRGYDHPTQTGPPDQTASACHCDRGCTGAMVDRRPFRGDRETGGPVLHLGRAAPRCLMEPRYAGRETGMWRNAGEQFESGFNLTAQR